MKLVATLALLAFMSSCASKKTTTAPAPTTAPAVTQAAETTAPAKKDDKKSNKKSKAKSEKTAAAGTDSTEKAATELTCKSGSDERKISIVTKGSGCELQYTKAGETKSVASQIVGNKKCEDVMNTIKEKLVAAQFTCQ